MILKRLIGLLMQRAPKEQYYLELGSYFIRKGTGYKVGQPFEYEQKTFKKGKNRVATKELYISNLFFNFKLNKITYKLDKNPILNRTSEES